MANELNTLADIRNAAINRVKGDAGDDATVNFFNEAINTRYRTICSRKKWKFLRVTNRSLKLPIKYTTGTITISNGSRSVTGTGTAWTSDMRHRWIKPSSTDNSYRVVQVVSATSLIIASPLVESTITNGQYKLYQSELALFPDLEDIDDIRIDGKPWLIEPVGPSEVSRLRQKHADREGAPFKYTIEGQSVYPGVLMQSFVMGYDFLGSGLTKAISLFPHIPDQDYTIHIPYKRKVSVLADSDEPLIPIEHRHVLLYFAMSDWYMKDRQDQTGKYYEALGKDELREMETKFLDTDDYLEFKAESFNKYSHSYLMRHSQYYFDREG